jgi:hypothetical protein
LWTRKRELGNKDENYVKDYQLICEIRGTTADSVGTTSNRCNYMPDRDPYLLDWR